MIKAPMQFSSKKYQIIAFLAFSVLAVPCRAQWKNLFDGQSFKGWTKYLGIPHQRTEGIKLPKDANGKYAEALGINNDPLGVFMVARVDGSPAIHVSGQVFGTLTFDQEFKNYHIKVDFKWGEKKWEPRQDKVRDAGLLYHGFGDPGSTNSSWHPAQECQIQEGDVGDYWPTGEVTIDIPSVKMDTSNYRVYKSNAPLHTFIFSDKMWERRCYKTPDNEKRTGEWNTVEVIAFGDSSIHVVNGKVVMRLYNSRKIENGQPVPLNRGKIALQSEGAELYYRNIKIRPIQAIPKEYAE